MSSVSSPMKTSPAKSSSSATANDVKRKRRDDESSDAAKAESISPEHKRPAVKSKDSQTSDSSSCSFRGDSSPEPKTAMDEARTPSPSKPKSTTATNTTKPTTGAFSLNTKKTTWDDIAEDEEKPMGLPSKTETKNGFKLGPATAAPPVFGATATFGRTSTLGNRTTEDRKISDSTAKGFETIKPGSLNSTTATFGSLSLIPTPSTTFSKHATTSSFSSLLSDTKQDIQGTNPAADDPPKVVVPTLEERRDEYRVAVVKGKLFHVGKDTNYKERGAGELKIYVNSECRSKARLLHHQTHTGRVLLNVQIFPQMVVTILQEKFLRFMACETPGTLTTFLLRTSKPREANAFQASLQFCIKDIEMGREITLPHLAGDDWVVEKSPDNDEGHDLEAGDVDDE